MNFASSCQSNSILNSRLLSIIANAYPECPLLVQVETIGQRRSNSDIAKFNVTITSSKGIMNLSSSTCRNDTKLRSKTSTCSALLFEYSARLKAVLFLRHIR